MHCGSRKYNVPNDSAFHAVRTLNVYWHDELLLQFKIGSILCMGGLKESLHYLSMCKHSIGSIKNSTPCLQLAKFHEIGIVFCFWNFSSFRSSDAVKRHQKITYCLTCFGHWLPVGKTANTCMLVPLGCKKELFDWTTWDILQFLCTLHQSFWASVAVLYKLYSLQASSQLYSTQNLTYGCLCLWSVCPMAIFQLLCH